MVRRGTHRYLKLGHSQIQLRTPAPNMDTTHKSTAAPARNKPTYDQTIPIGQGSLPQYDSAIPACDGISRRSEVAVQSMARNAEGRSGTGPASRQ
jgi:hypothetical protein